MKLLLYTIMLALISCSGNSESKDSAEAPEAPLEEVLPEVALEDTDSAIEDVSSDEISVTPILEQPEIIPSFNAQYLGVPNVGTYGESSYLLFQLLFDTPVTVSGSPSFLSV